MYAKYRDRLHTQFRFYIGVSLFTLFSGGKLIFHVKSLCVAVPESPQRSRACMKHRGSCRLAGAIIVCMDLNLSSAASSVSCVEKSRERKFFDGTPHSQFNTHTRPFTRSRAYRRYLAIQIKVSSPTRNRSDSFSPRKAS